MVRGKSTSYKARAENAAALITEFADLSGPWKESLLQLASEAQIAHHGLGLIKEIWKDEVSELADDTWVKAIDQQIAERLTRLPEAGTGLKSLIEYSLALNKLMFKAYLARGEIISELATRLVDETDQMRSLEEKVKSKIPSLGRSLDTETTYIPGETAEQ